MSVPVYPKRSTYRLNQRKALTGSPSVHDHTSNRVWFGGDDQRKVFTAAKGNAANLSKKKSRDNIKPRKFSWEDKQ
jgi:hypothetical protein